MSDSAGEFLLERYKYILDQKKALNETTFKIAALYQAVIVVLFAGEFAVVKDFLSRGVSAEVAKMASWAIFAMNLLLATICLTLLIGGALAWLSYRKEQIEIELYAMKMKRQELKKTNLLRWYETYIAISIVSVSLFHLVLLCMYISPLLSS